ncbi:MAG: sodium/proton antiporter NhaB [Syntrophobacteraceae bacterium]
MPKTISQAFNVNFLGNSPSWYKFTIIGFLVFNPLLLFTAGPFVTGWLIIGEFIFTLAMALKCYPLPPGGLLAIQAVLLGMTSPKTIYTEIAYNLPVILLLIFMVTGIYFMKELLQYVFTKILLGVRSKLALSLLFCFTGAFLSAFLDALTVTAVVMSVAYGFYDIYHRFASGSRGSSIVHDCRLDVNVEDCHRSDLDSFRGFLRNLMMHAAVGTALGGVTTLVGEPQNLLIGSVMGWDFGDFFIRVAPVSIPVFFMGMLTCAILERFKVFGYGYLLPEGVRCILAEQFRADELHRTPKSKARLIIQGVAACLLVVCLALHLAEVGIIGLMVIVLLTAGNGVTEEHRIGRAFEESLPFTTLLAVFFAIVAMIHDQHLFTPIIRYVLTLEGREQLAAFYVANGLLSMISDNVFVATVYISETAAAFKEGLIQKEQFYRLAVSINTGTNIPSVATPNGQAAFLFLLTSALSPLIRLSYGQMVKLALPYTIVMSVTGFLATWFLL